MLVNHALKLKLIEFKYTSPICNNICEWSPRVGQNTCASGLACAPSLSSFYFAPSLARENEDYCHSVEDINSSSTIMRGQSYILNFL